MLGLGKGRERDCEIEAVGPDPSPGLCGSQLNLPHQSHHAGGGALGATNFL